MAAVPASHPSLLRKELSVTSFFILTRIRDFPPFVNLANDHRESVLLPSPAPSRGPRSLLPGYVRGAPEGEGLPLKRRRHPAPPGARGSGERRAGAPRQPPSFPPSRPRRGPAALPAGGRGRGGKVSLQILPGRASGHSPPPRKSVACSFPWKPGGEGRRGIVEGTPQGCGTCGLGARGRSVDGGCSWWYRVLSSVLLGDTC